MLCTGEPPMTDKRAAGGDSGGPVFALNADETPVLIGLVSFGPPEDKVGPNDYDVNADVAFYSDWLRATMKDYTKAGTMNHMEADDEQRTAVVTGASVDKFQLLVWSITPKDLDHKVRIELSATIKVSDTLIVVDGLFKPDRHKGEVLFRVNGGDTLANKMFTSHADNGIMTLEAIIGNSEYGEDAMLTVKYWQVAPDQFPYSCPFGTVHSETATVLDDVCKDATETCVKSIEVNPVDPGTGNVTDKPNGAVGTANFVAFSMILTAFLIC